MDSRAHNYYAGSSFSNPEQRRNQVDPTDQESIKQTRYRSAFTTSQINHMESVFKKHPYVDKPMRVHLAQILNIPERCIKVWFQNRRMKEKISKEEMHTVNDMSILFRDESHTLKEESSTNRVENITSRLDNTTSREETIISRENSQTSKEEDKVSRVESLRETLKKTPTPVFKGNPVLSTNERNLCSLPKPLEAPPEIPKKPNAHSKIFKAEQNKRFTEQGTPIRVMYPIYDFTQKKNKQVTKNNTKDDPQRKFRTNFYKEPMNQDDSSFSVQTSSFMPLDTSDSEAKYKASAEYSIDLCKKYKDMFKSVKSEPSELEKNNNQVPLIFQPTSNNKHDQLETLDMPQDLSIKKNSSYYQEEAISLKHTPNTSATGPLFVNVNQTYYRPNNTSNSKITFSPSCNLLAIDRSAQFKNYYNTNEELDCESNSFNEQNQRSAPPLVATKHIRPAMKTFPTNSSASARSVQYPSSSYHNFSAQHSSVQSAPASPSHHVGFAMHMEPAQYVSSLQNINSAHYINPVQRMTSVEHISSGQYSVKSQYAHNVPHVTDGSDGNSQYPYKLDWPRI